MISNEKGGELHNRLTDGEKLSEEEQKSLQEWYDYMDEQEMKELGLEEGNENDSPSQVEELLEQIKISNQEYKETLTRNARLRVEREALRQKIAQLYDRKRA